MNCFRRVMHTWLFLCLYAALTMRAQTLPNATINGTVFDPSGAAIPGAALHLYNAAIDRTGATDARGHFTLKIPAGTYTFTVEARGFRIYTRPDLVISPRSNPPLRITLEIATATEEVNVASEQNLNTDAASNRSALVFKGDQLDTFSDDPSTMQQQLLALAGNDPGNPAQIYVDGFSNGTLPAKESIREVRINQDPFSSQYDQFGMGRIEVSTKPGANKLHGNVETNYGNSHLNARNPYTGAQPPYNNDYSTASLDGPVGKNSSFFLTAQRSDLSTNAVVNAVTLDDNLNQVTVSQAIANPTVSQTFSGRFDRQFGAKDTFTSRYTFSEITQPNLGIGLLVLPTQASSSAIHTQTLQLTDTHLFGSKVVLDAGFQYIRTRQRQDAISNAPTLIVQGSFSQGGSPTQSLHDDQDRLELQQYFSIVQGKHLIRTGLRYRLLHDANLSTAGYNGQFVFPDLDTYRNTRLDLLNGLDWKDIRAKGDGPSQFSLATGTPSASLITGDLGIYAEDEWKARPDLTLNYGLRIESQSAIPDHLDLAPRLGFAYSFKPKKSKEPFAVLRGGFGIFYQRFASADILQSLRQNGTTEQVFYIANPDFYSDIPDDIPDPASLTATTPTVYRINPYLRSPMQMQGLITVEHSFGKFGSIAVNYFQRRSTHNFESLNINAPLPGTAARPFGGSGNIYEYSSDGISNGHTLSTNLNINASRKLSVWAFFAAGHQETDTFGPDNFATNSYDLKADTGMWAGYTPRQFYTGFDAHPGWDTSFNMFISVLSQSHFDITTGQDNNGDSIYNDRPAFATDLTRASVVHTAFGDFDSNPLPGQTIIPINYGQAPGFVYTALYFTKNFRFGPRPAVPPPPAGHNAPPSGHKADLPPPRYRLQFGIGADNLLNHVNPGLPIGVLTSRFFGKSISLNAPFSNNTAANRAVTLRAAFYF